MIAALAQILDDRQPVALREHAVHDQHVVAAVRGHCRAAVPIGGVVRHVSGFAQRLGQVGRRFLIVLDQQNPHGVTIQRQGTPR